MFGAIGLDNRQIFREYNRFNEITFYEFQKQLHYKFPKSLVHINYVEAAGTAARLKHGCPVAKYFLLAEYLDMEPEDSRLASIDNVFVLRRTNRLPVPKRDSLADVEVQCKKTSNRLQIDLEICGKRLT
jgi:hypothetical protein